MHVRFQEPLTLPLRERREKMSQSYKTRFMLSSAYSFMNCKTIIKSWYYRKIRSGSLPLSLKLIACTLPNQLKPTVKTGIRNHHFWASPHSSTQTFHLPIQVKEHGGRDRSRGNMFIREKPGETQEVYSLEYNIFSVSFPLFCVWSGRNSSIKSLEGRELLTHP